MKQLRTRPIKLQFSSSGKLGTWSGKLGTWLGKLGTWLGKLGTWSQNRGLLQQYYVSPGLFQKEMIKETIEIIMLSFVCGTKTSRSEGKLSEN